MSMKGINKSMKVEIRGNVFEGTPKEIREYVNVDQEYINEMFKFGKCPACSSELGNMEASEHLDNYLGGRYIGYRKKCKQCRKFWGYNKSTGRNNHD